MLFTPGASRSQSSVPGSGSDDQVVVAIATTIGQMYGLPLNIDPGDLAEHDLRVLLRAEDRPDGARDIPRRERRRRHLV
jgi:hypothetical protein